MIDVIGTCVYCGQTRMVKVKQNDKKDVANYEATMQCNCDMAKEYQKTETKIAVAQRTVKNKLVIKEELQEPLIKLVELVGHGYVDKVTIQKSGVTISVKDTKDSINVEKRIVTVESHKG